MPTYIRDDGAWKTVSGGSIPAATVPTGAVFHFAASTPPTGYLKANGDTVPNGTGTVQGISANFSDLYAILGSTYGAAGKLPDLRNKFAVGSESLYALAATGGSADATLVSHNHTATSSVTDPGHGHAYTESNNQNVVRGSFGASAPNCNVGVFGATTSSQTTGITVATSISTEGSSATNANLPPYLALLPCIKY